MNKKQKMLKEIVETLSFDDINAKIIHNDMIFEENDEFTISFQDDELCISFNYILDPTRSAYIIKYLIENIDYKFEIYEPYIITDDGDMLWDDEMEKYCHDIAGCEL